MKIDYLADGSDDCPIVRIYQCTNQEYHYLYSEIDKLARGGTSFSIQGTDSSVNINFSNSITDIGLIKKTDDEFNCLLSKETYLRILGLLGPFINADELIKNGNGYQWLDETSEISLLLTSYPNGAW